MNHVWLALETNQGAEMWELNVSRDNSGATLVGKNCSLKGDSKFVCFKQEPQTQVENVLMQTELTWASWTLYWCMNSRGSWPKKNAGMGCIALANMQTQTSSVAFANIVFVATQISVFLIFFYWSIRSICLHACVQAHWQQWAAF